MERKKASDFGEGELCQRFPGPYSGLLGSPSYLSEVGGLARLVLGDLVHSMLGALFRLAVGPPLLRDVHHLSVLAPCRSHPTKATYTGRQGKSGKATQRCYQGMNRMVRFAVVSRGGPRGCNTAELLHLAHAQRKHRRPQLQEHNSTRTRYVKLTRLVLSSPIEGRFLHIRSPPVENSPFLCDWMFS